MKRLLFLFWFINLSLFSYAQAYLLAELPYRGIPEAMYQTKNGSFITVIDAVDSLDQLGNPVLIKHDKNGNLLKTVELSSGFAINMLLVQVAFFDSSYLFLYTSSIDSGRNISYFDTSLNKISEIRLANNFTPYNFAVIDTKCYSAWKYGFSNSTLERYDSTFNRTDTVLIPSFVEFKEFRRSPSGYNIITNGPDNPNFPTDLHYYVYDDSLKLVANKVYKDKDHIPFALDDGWLFYRDGLFRVNNSLDSIWYKPPSTYKISGFTVQETTDLKKLPDGGYIMTGQMFNSIFATTFIVRTDSLGNVIYKNKIPLFADKVVSIEQRADGKFVLFAAGYPDSLNRDKLFMLLVNADGTIGISNNQSRLESSIKVFPNPIVEHATIAFTQPFVGTVKLYSIEGKLILEESLNAVEQYEMNAGSIKGGVYILTIENSEGILQKKIVKQ